MAFPDGPVFDNKGLITRAWWHYFSRVVVQQESVKRWTNERRIIADAIMPANRGLDRFLFIWRGRDDLLIPYLPAPSKEIEMDVLDGLKGEE